MKIFDTGGYLTFLVSFYYCYYNIDHRFASLTSGIEHVLNDVTYVTRHNK